MEIELEDARVVTYTEYRELLTLYVKQIVKTDELQRENVAMHNLILELRESVDKWKIESRKRV